MMEGPRCKWKKVTMLECWYLVLVGTHSLNILVWKVTMPQCWLFRVMELKTLCFKYKKVTHLNAGYLGWRGPMPQCLGAKGQYTWILVIWNGWNPCMNVLSIKVYQSYVNWLGVKNWIYEREKVITFECWLFVMVGTTAVHHQAH